MASKQCKANYKATHQQSGKKAHRHRSPLQRKLAAERNPKKKVAIVIVKHSRPQSPLDSPNAFVRRWHLKKAMAELGMY